MRAMRPDGKETEFQAVQLRNFTIEGGNNCFDERNERDTK
jgi:hypothetical protein